MISKPLANAIIVLVSLVWAGNFVASVFVSGYQPDTALNFVFMAIVGSALALKQDGTGSMMARVVATIRGTTPPQDPPKKEGQE